LIDTTASEKNITCPTDAKLAIKIIHIMFVGGQLQGKNF
jgi:hypothetical protein